MVPLQFLPSAVEFGEAIPGVFHAVAIVASTRWGILATTSTARSTKATR
jgi:hypothetical protein